MGLVDDISRRCLLFGAGALAIGGSPAWAAARPVKKRAAPAPRNNRLNPDERQFLDDYEKRCFRYFWEQWDPHTGLFMDRAHWDGTPVNHVGSAAATGFGLTALCIGADNGWIPRDQARNRILTTLQFLWAHAFHEHGWFLHFMDGKTGERRLRSEVSSVDSALLLAGVLTAQGYFSMDKVVNQLARQIFERVDFAWMLNGDSRLLSHGLVPGGGFLDSRWKAYSEASILYLLAIGAPRTAISPESWYAWLRPEVHYEKWKFVSGGPLFTHQFSHAWVDFRHQKDGDPFYVDYFENSQIATYAHRDFCINLKARYGDYGPDMWGITVSDSASGYVNWGGPPNEGPIDGTVVPCAAAGSLMFAPEICLPVLRQMYATYGDHIFGRYGFTDAFNPNSKDGKIWINSDVIGIDVGISLLSIENLMSGNVWRWFMANQYIQRGMERVGFRLATPGISIREKGKGTAKI